MLRIILGLVVILVGIMDGRVCLKSLMEEKYDKATFFLILLILSFISGFGLLVK